MQADATAVGLPSAAPPRDPKSSAIKTLLKNALVLGGLAGAYAAVETGYFSNDRTSRREWNEMERLKEKGKPISVYEANLRNVRINADASPEGGWGFYNGATDATVAVLNGELVLNYTSAWIGGEFRHTTFQPGTVYRLTIEAMVEKEPAAILMRNRQLDLMREQIPVTDGEFKTFRFHYVTPGGSLDRVRLILMPDNRGSPKGKMTVRKFKIERLEG